MLTRIKLAESEPTRLTLDDDVLECFFVDGSKRIHVSHINGIELSADNKGKHLLTIQLQHNNLFLWVDDKPLAQVKELVDRLKQAVSSSKT